MSEVTREGHSPFLPRLAELLQVEFLSQNEKLFRLRLQDGSALNHRPGQFLEVSVFGVGEVPISVASSPTRDSWFELGVRLVGSVTRALHQLHSGDVLGIRGPFGNGFPVSDLAGQDLLFIAGGIGLCPLRSMIQYASDRRDQFGRIILLYGCRQPAEQLFREELAEWRQRQDIQLLESVDRCPLDVAWEGGVGIITTLFSQVEVDPDKTTALMVGPPVMYRHVVAECLDKGIAEEKILLSLERRMKCGIGLCGHCQINNVYVCLEGPVFSYASLTELRGVEV